MRICSACHTIKEETEFYLQDKKTGRRHAECKACYSEHRKSYYKLHYLKYGDQYRQRAKVRRARIKKELQIKMLAYLRDKSCQICGETDARVLDFDHIKPTQKSFSIARGLTHGYDWKIIIKEIAKCRILCANCHRKHTASQYNWYRVADN